MSFRRVSVAARQSITESNRSTRRIVISQGRPKTGDRPNGFFTERTLRDTGRQMYTLPRSFRVDCRQDEHLT